MDDLGEYDITPKPKQPSSWQLLWDELTLLVIILCVFNGFVAAYRHDWREVGIWTLAFTGWLQTL